MVSSSSQPLDVYIISHIFSSVCLSFSLSNYLYIFFSLSHSLFFCLTQPTSATWNWLFLQWQPLSHNKKMYKKIIYINIYKKIQWLNKRETEIHKFNAEKNCLVNFYQQTLWLWNHDLFFISCNLFYFILFFQMN